VCVCVCARARARASVSVSIVFVWRVLLSITSPLAHYVIVPEDTIFRRSLLGMSRVYLEYHSGKYPTSFRTLRHGWSMSPPNIDFPV